MPLIQKISDDIKEAMKAHDAERTSALRFVLAALQAKQKEIFGQGSEVLADEEAVKPMAHWGVFGTTLVAFFLAEMGDKTQIATVGLAARFDEFYAVVAGTTAGMMIANVPAVFLGEKIAQRVSMTLVHSVAAGIFAILGVLTLLNVGRLF